MYRMVIKSRGLVVFRTKLGGVDSLTSYKEVPRRRVSLWKEKPPGGRGGDATALPNLVAPRASGPGPPLSQGTAPPQRTAPAPAPGAPPSTLGSLEPAEIS